MLRLSTTTAARSLSSRMATAASSTTTRKISRSTPRKNAHSYTSDPTVGPMLQYQRSLPRLPVPTLDSTAAKYLETVEPLVTPNEFAETKKAVETFVTSPLGKELQKRLQDRAADPSRASWLAEWWNDVAYMSYRDPVVVFVRCVCGDGMVVAKC